MTSGTEPPDGQTPKRSASICRSPALSPDTNHVQSASASPHDSGANLDGRRVRGITTASQLGAGRAWVGDGLESTNNEVCRECHPSLCVENGRSSRIGPGARVCKKEQI